MKIKRVILSLVAGALAILLGFPLTTFAQQEALTDEITAYIKNFDIKDGIVQNNINAVLKDKEGFVWVGTEEGLLKYNGHEFKAFAYDPSDSSSLSDNVVTCLFEDTKDRLWVGTQTGLNLLDKRTETFTRFFHDPENENSLTQNAINSITEDHQGNFWIGTQWGLNRFREETGQFDRYFYGHNERTLTSNIVHRLHVDADGVIWIGTHRGVTLLQQQDDSILFNARHEKAYQQLAHYSITSIVQDEGGNHWIGTWGNGAFFYNQKNQTIENFGHGDVGSDIVNNIMIDADGMVWLGTFGNGISIYDPRKRTFHKLTPKNDASFVRVTVNELYLDTENIVWIGTSGFGLKSLNIARRKFTHIEYFDAYQRKMGRNSILALAQDNDENVWIGTDGVGLYRYNPRDGTFKAYRHDPDDPRSLSGNIVKSLLLDSKGNLYAGTYGEGLNYLDIKTNEITRYKPDPEDSNSLSGADIWELYEDSESRIWVGTLGSGLNEFLPEEKVFIQYKAEVEDSTTLPSNFISKIYEDSYGHFWIGTIGGGICKMDKSKGVFKRYFTNSDREIPGTSEVIDLYESHDRKLWMGSKGNGLFAYDNDNDQFKLVNHKESMQSSIQSILEDDDGNLWLSSYKGVIKFNPSNGSLVSYDQYDGLQSQEFNARSKLRGVNGDFYFGGFNGLNIFNPQKTFKDQKYTPVVFTGFYLFHKEISPRSHPGLLPSHINYLDEITLSAGQNVFSIQYASLNYSFPKKNKYAYLLEGFDESWNYVEDERTATYTNIPPGVYLFRVISSNGDGIWNETGKTITIRILSAWYEEPWVLGGALILLVVLVFLIIKIRIYRLSSEQENLERLVQQRTDQIHQQNEEIGKKNKELELQNTQIKASNHRIEVQNGELEQKNAEIIRQQHQINEKSKLLASAHDQVQAANRELKRLNNDLEHLVDLRTSELQEAIEKLIKTDEGLRTFLYRSSHDLRGPITTLLGLAQLAEKENHQTDIDNYIKKIKSSGHQMLRFLKKLNETNVVFRMERSLERINWNQIISDVEAEIDHLYTEKKAEFIIENKVEHDLLSDNSLIRTIVHNLVENAIIFNSGASSRVKLTLSYANLELKIKVTDNGHGIDDKIKTKIFDMFYRGSEQSKGNGLGLFLAKRAVEMLEGQISFKSLRGETTFLVTIPVVASQKKKTYFLDQIF